MDITSDAGVNLVLSEKIYRTIIKNSKLDLIHKYIGMSQLHGCAQEIYKSYFFPMNPSYNDYRNSYRGYFFEREMKKILIESGVMEQDSERELFAPNSERISGHTDGETHDGILIEIKSVSQEKFERIRNDGKLPYKIFHQCNTYMGYGNYNKCKCIVFSTGTFEHIILDVNFNYKIFGDAQTKANYILGCIDSEKVPHCNCRNCSNGLKKAV